MESFLVIIIVGCAALYCAIGLKKILTGQKRCNCSSAGGADCCASGQSCVSADCKNSDNCC